MEVQIQAPLPYLRATSLYHVISSTVVLRDVFLEHASRPLGLKIWSFILQFYQFLEGFLGGATSSFGPSSQSFGTSHAKA